MAIAPAQLARDLRDAPALASDPRPGTRSLERTALASLGIELVACERTHVVVRLAPPLDAFGPLLVAAETAASTAANLRCGSSLRAFGAELDAAGLAAPAPGAVVVTATGLAIGDHHHVWRVAAFDAHDAQVLEGRCTLGVVRAPAG
jgi:hypothetical protein